MAVQVGGIITVPLIVSYMANDPAVSQYLISASLIVAGICTVVHVSRHARSCIAAEHPKHPKSEKGSAVELYMFQGVRCYVFVQTSPQKTCRMTNDL